MSEIDLSTLQTKLKDAFENVVGKPTKSCTPTCLPFYIYVGISLISIIGGLFMGPGGVASRLGAALMGVLWSALWAGLIYYLCGRCQQGWGWFILLLPTILLGLSVLFLVLSKSVSPRRNAARQ